MSPIIGLIGCGAWGRLILRDLKSCGAIVHVVAPSEGSRRNAVEQRADTIVGALSGLPAVDGYVVATPSSLHAEIIDTLLPTGRPIYTEKPLTVDVASAERIAARAGDRVFVMQKWRYHPGIERMRQEIANGTVGDVRAIHIQRWGWGHPHFDTTAIWTLMPHDLSIVLHWLGDIPPVRSVRATVPGRIDLGLIAELGDAHLPISIDMSTVAPVHRRTFTLIGSKATLTLGDSYDAAIHLRRGAPGALDAAADTIAIGGDMPLLLEVQAFLAHLRGGPPPMTSAHEGLLIVRRTAEIEAAAHAAHRG
jgi:predicted dehydrogenase